MTSGFTLGQADGATLGQSAGGTLGVSQLGTYKLAGSPLPGLVDETATNRTLTLTFRLTTHILTSRARDLKTNEGRVDVLSTDDGGFTAVDRADGANTVRLDPPARREPLRRQGDVHVARYEESMVSAGVDEWDLTVELIRSTDRTDTPSLSQSRGSGEWKFATRRGDVATSRVDAEFLGTGASGVDRFELTTRLTFDQAHVMESALARLDGVRIRQIAGGTNRAVDETSGTGNTVDVTAPTTAGVVEDGDYVVLGWESTRLNEAYQEFEMEVAKTP